MHTLSMEPPHPASQIIHAFTVAFPGSGNQRANNVLTTCYQRAINVLTTCYVLTTCSTCYQRAINVLSTCYQRAINVLTTCYQRAINVLTTCYQRANNVLSTCYRRDCGRMLQREKHNYFKIQPTSTPVQMPPV